MEKIGEHTVKDAHKKRSRNNVKTVVRCKEYGLKLKYSIEFI